jgi:hypothetical protein
MRDLMMWIILERFLKNFIEFCAYMRFKVKRRLVLSLYLPYIVFAGADAASRNRNYVAFRACLRFINMKGRFDDVSNLESTVMGTTLMISARIELLYFLYKVLHVCHP